MGARHLRAAALLLAAALAGCMQFGITIVPPPPDRPEPPRPAAISGTDAPELEATDADGLLRAHGVEPPMYYYEPDDLWYRYYKGRWHQAFFWNGTWFEPERLPPALRSRERTKSPDAEVSRPATR